MKFWVVEPLELSLEVFLPDPILVGEICNAGMNAELVRRAAICHIGSTSISFRLVTPGGRLSTRKRNQIPDFCLWSWIPILSHRAMNLLVDLGASTTDFLLCHFNYAEDAKAYLYLPQNGIDVIDIANSRFVMTIPGDPPLPHGIRHLAIRPSAIIDSNIFRIAVPEQNQVFSEVIVSSKVVSEWNSRAFTGAKFRPLN